MTDDADRADTPDPPDPPEPLDLPPLLPVDTAHRQVPRAIRDFLACLSDEVVVPPGRLFWVGLPGGVRPDVRFSPGARRGTVEIVVSLVGLGVLETRVTAEVRDGALVVDTRRVPDPLPGLGDVRAAVAVWLAQLEARLARNGKELGDLRLRRGRLRLTMVNRLDRSAEIEQIDLTAESARGCRASTGSLAAAFAATSRRALRRPPLW